ncbi:MAG: 30S ribosomal protein S12 methylthiotransferase RimO [Candidatus Omnitrophica bacterium]|nr:30S ribosomal protein S12 methylthiotransferase RimO [Candidatus Omnitrophota bacterium]
MKPHSITIGILSLGCPKNLVDSEVLLGFLEQEGFSISFDVTNCDVALINTCAFVDDACQESLDMIEEVCNLKKEGHVKYVIVCGCLPQRYPEGIDTCREKIDAYIGTGEITQIGTIVRAVLNNEKPVECTSPTYLYSHKSPRFFLTPPFVKYVKIAEGCDHQCSFCVIPHLRGSYRSREIESIVTEVTSLVDQGLREVVLIAQDTSYYGKDRYGQLRFADLLHAISNIKGLTWIRPLYLHPKHITADLVSVYKSNDTICKYIDIPLQHINNDILRSMRRGITREEITDLIHFLRQEIEGVVIRTAFIVGYPGEGYEEFNELLDFIDEMAFERLGAFIYSREDGAHAASLEDTVSETVKKSRFQDIMLLQQKISREKNSQLKNKVFQTLIEGYNEDKPDFFIGRTYMDAPEVDGLIYVKKKRDIEIGNFYPVKVMDTFEYDLVGKIVKK